MNLYSNAIEDERVRRYLPVNRVMAGENFLGAEAVVNNPEVQLFLWGKTKPECTIQPGGWILVDFGIELHGGVRLLSREAGKIRLRFGESAGEAMQEPNQDHAVHDTELLLPRNGMIEYGNTAFRFARIDSLEPEKNLAFQNILAVALYRELEWTGSFESSDERLNRIWKTGAYTVLLNMQDYIYDGAKRDRLPWMGDLNPELRTILAVFSDTSLVRRTLDYLKKQTPLPGWMNGIVTYSLWFIISHWEYYRHTGDRNYLAAQKEYIDELLKHFAGMIAPGGAERIVGRRFLDWPNNDNPQGLHAGLHGLLYWAFRCGLNYLPLAGNGHLALPHGTGETARLHPGLRRVQSRSGNHDHQRSFRLFPGFAPRPVPWPQHILRLLHALRPADSERSGSHPPLLGRDAGLWSHDFLGGFRSGLAEEYLSDFRTAGSQQERPACGFRRILLQGIAAQPVPWLGVRADLVPQQADCRNSLSGTRRRNDFNFSRSLRSGICRGALPDSAWTGYSHGGKREKAGNQGTL